MSPKRKLRLATVLFWVLLLYIVAALVWWAFSLLQQNKDIHALKREALDPAAAGYASSRRQIDEAEKRGEYKYIGEGCAFLLLICVGGGFIYRSVRQQFRLQQQQQNFVMAVTHELKTPIAVAKLNLETLQKHQLEEPKKAKLLQTTMQETLRLETLINNILLASQLEDHAYRMTRDELDFSGLVSDAAKTFEARYPNRPLHVSIESDREVTGDAVLLKLMLSNLLENANKYSPRGRPVGLRVYQKPGAVVLEVADEGPGIDDEEKQAVFEKFYRIGNEQTRKTQGTGLGLFICQKIAEDHGAGIAVKDNQPAGSKFIVQFYT